MSFAPILIQAAYYFVVLVLGLLIVAIVQKGFFVPYIKVRLSFGKFLLCKIRAVNRDYFRVGRIEEGFLVYQGVSGIKRISIEDSSVFYRSIAVVWIDIDDEKNAICKPDYSAIPGFDAIKYDNLYKRALTRPSVNDNREKIIIGMLGLGLLFLVVLGFLVYKNGYSLEFIMQKIGSIGGTVAPGG